MDGVWYRLFVVSLVILAAGAATQQEQQVLIEFKRGIVDPAAVLENWNATTNPDVCRWQGVKCDGTGNATTVVGINFRSLNLNGTVSPIICELPNLASLVVADNNFDQTFPLALSRCRNLLHLDLSSTYFHGPIPSNLSDFARLPLRTLDMSYTSFSGPIPDALGQLSSLEELYLGASSFTHLPSNLDGLSNLTVLSVAWSPHLVPAAIPPRLGNLSKLVHLSLSGCSLLGPIPPQLGALKELDFLELQQNSLTGSIPVELMSLPKITKLVLYQNLLSGQIPHQIGNLASLTEFDASINSLTGIIPAEIGQLENLELLRLNQNQLTGEIPASLANLTRLWGLVLFVNNLNGTIPQSLGEKANFSIFSVSQNRLTGNIPPHLCSGNALENLTMYENMLSGTIPETYGACKSLIRLRLHDNSLQGHVPRGLWNSPNMLHLELSFNKLSGSVTPDIAGAVKMGNLLLDGNQFEGPVPEELGNLPNLISFSAADNLISGISLGRCASLTQLNLSRNRLSGALPTDITNCMKLTTLDLSGNNLSGPLPASLGLLSQLNTLDLSDNQFGGDIPPVLGNLLLSSLNVSYNHLRGSIPESWKSFSANGFLGNPDICLNSTCAEADSRSRSKVHFPVFAVVFTVTIALLLVGTVCICWHHLKFLKSKHQPQWQVKSFQRLDFNELAVIEKLHEDNIIGSGQSSKVYRIDVARGHSQFQAEVSTLGQLRHRNVVRLLSCCWNANTNVLIFEYAPNGSLGDVLHGKQARNLDWNTRFKISLGVAQGLSYLHHDCSPPILHRDIKSNNILLDATYEPKLADFGIAKRLRTSNNQTMTDIAGTYGYIAPEYTYTLKVNMKSDTYSFGVVLLELVTGRRPVDSEFGDVDIVRWVKSKVHTKGPQSVLDPRLSDTAKDELTKLLDIALRCTHFAPEERPSMRQVVEMLERIQAQHYYFPHTAFETFSPSSTSGSTSPCSSKALLS